MKNIKLTILGISIWKLFAYFIIYSFIGYIIETLFGIVTKGVWESRQSFLYGPFCGIYGSGAVIITLFAKYFDKNKLTLFIGGFLIGTITEYLTSFLVETTMGITWWDYSNYILNINGRVCLLYSIFWGILTPFLIKILNVKIDIIISKIKEKVSIKLLKAITLTIIIFLFIDCFLTCFAQKQFINRMIIEKNIEVDNIEKVLVEYDSIYNNEILSKIILKFWNDRKMIRTFPNMKIEDKEGNDVYLDSLLPDIQAYYLKIFNK